jgi:DNA-binding CsgD family transcriptional regulator
MANLGVREYQRILDIVVAVLDGQEPDPPWTVITKGLNDAFRGTAAIFHGEFRPALATANVLAWAPDEIGTIPLDERQREMGAAHPLAHVYATGDRTPWTVSDVINEAAWRQNACYAATKRDFDGGVRHLAIPLYAPVGAVRAFMVCRSGKDFGSRDRELALRVQPLLTSLDRHLTELQRLRRRSSDPRSTVSRDNQGADLGVTPRELTVLALLAEGGKATAIARRLGVTPSTVTKHQENLYRKLGTTDRLATVLLAQALGLVAVPPAFATPYYQTQNGRQRKSR